MRKLAVVILILGLIIFPKAFAMGFDEGYNLGSQIGSSIGSAMGAAAAERAWKKGDVSRKIEVNNDYDFSRLRTFLVFVKSNGNYPIIQQDNNYEYLHTNTLINRLSNKYFVFDFYNIYVNVAQANPKLDRNSKEFMSKVMDEIEKFDAWLTINVYSFNTTNEGYTNVSYDITVNPLKSTEQVFSYKESRFNVPYKSGYELFNEICTRFEPQFSKYFKNSLKSKKNKKNNF